MLTDYFYVDLRQAVKVVLPLDATTEVISLTRGEICQIPGVSPALLGVVNQRGKLLWVLDLSDLLQISPSPTPLRVQDKLTLIGLSDRSSNEEADTRQVACVVSAIKGIIPLNRTKIQPQSTNVSSYLKSFLSGMTVIENSEVGVVNVLAVLAAIQSSVTSTSLAHNL